MTAGRVRVSLGPPLTQSSVLSRQRTGMEHVMTKQTESEHIYTGRYTLASTDPGAGPTMADAIVNLTPHPVVIVGISGPYDPSGMATVAHERAYQLDPPHSARVTSLPRLWLSRHTGWPGWWRRSRTARHPRTRRGNCSAHTVAP